MTFTPPFRKLALTAHITASVGWLGAVAAFVALAVMGLASMDSTSVRGAYLAMATVASYVIVPLCLAALATGLSLALGTKWGLFRHYWVMVKLAVTALSTLVLLLHMHPITALAEAAAEGPLEAGELQGFRVQLVANAAAALMALLLNLTLSVYKPRGLTPYGQRKRREELGAEV
ncbi:MAG TPA: hypothetical protein VNZ52_06715 [Candidatus Thermoplasmatota archaeon]|nr:hypothetical protein [Candidatus Thermoplasmatota archaeon]